MTNPEIPKEMTAQEQVTEIRHEFMSESAVYPSKLGVEREATLARINYLLDEYLDMWPQLMEA